MNVLLINAVCGTGSTGKICGKLAQEFEQDGHAVKIAYGNSTPYPSGEIVEPQRVLQKHTVACDKFKGHWFGHWYSNYNTIREKIDFGFLDYL